MFPITSTVGCRKETESSDTCTSAYGIRAKRNVYRSMPWKHMGRVGGWGRCISPLVLHLVVRRRWVVKFTLRPLCMLERTQHTHPVLFEYGSGLGSEALGICWRREKSFTPAWVQTPYRLAQWWANYGPRARCGPLRSSVRPAADFKIVY